MTPRLSAECPLSKRQLNNKKLIHGRDKHEGCWNSSICSVRPNYCTD